MPIADAKIDEVRAAVDIVDIVGDEVRLKKSGSRFKGLCPFHNEKTPSFSVDPDQNLYYCFGCQAGGDAFKFVQSIHGVGFLEAVRMLAQRYGIALPENERDREAANERESILHALRFAARFFYHHLTQTDAGRPALDYLRDRGLKPKTIKRFGLGYAPDAWDHLLNAATQRHIEPETLEKAGLIIARNDGSGHYDRYRGRVIFPIFSHIGKVLGFAGRILASDRDQPKYINSPETQVYHKKEVLYGLHQAKRAIRDTDEVILVEGYTDVIALSQAGHANVVASSGTALTKEQVQVLNRYAKRVLLLYDADEAGARAAVRGMNRVLAEGLGAYAVELPDGEDPDSYVRKEGAEAFGEHLKTARQDLPSFLYKQAQRSGELDTPEDRVAVQRRIMASIAHIPDPNLRREYVVRASDVMRIPDADLFRMLEEELEKKKRQDERRARRDARRAARQQQDSGTAPGAPGGNGSVGEPPPPEDGDPGPGGGPHPMEPAGHAADGPAEAQGNNRPPQRSGPLPEEQILLRLMLEEGRPMVEFVLGKLQLNEFTEGPTRQMVQAFVQMYHAGAVQPDRITNGDFGDRVQQLAIAVTMDEHEPSAHWARSDVRVPRMNQEPRKAAESAMRLLRLDRLNAAIHEARQDMYRAHNTEGDDERQALEYLNTLQKERQKVQRGEFLR